MFLLRDIAPGDLDDLQRAAVHLDSVNLPDDREALAAIIERSRASFAGELPVWLAPVQAIVLPISDRHVDYGATVVERLRDAGVRVELDGRTESISRKIRDAELRKIPYMLVVGDREQETAEVALREHGRGDAGSVTVGAFADRAREETKSRSAR